LEQLVAVRKIRIKSHGRSIITSEEDQGGGIKLVDYNCGVCGHIATICSNGEIKLSHQKEQPTDKQPQAIMQRISPLLKYNSPFYGYYFSCNDFGHRAIDCRAPTRNKN